ncbi:MAG: acyl-CoA dehydrogenase family protein [Candidatus Sumerlaeota bacterium]|nr:acyl-CoA dehydrogenase family protein [Candidatus Sumerlaeota bacterium]
MENLYGFTEEQIMIHDLARKFADERIRFVRAELDEKEEFPHDLLQEMAATGLMGIYIGEAYGGMGGGALELCIATEQISRVCAGVGVSFAANALGSYPVILHGTDELRKKYLPPLAEGKTYAAFCLTEPGVGSDAAGIQTTAKLDGDFYIINGTKQWITNGGVANWYTVIAMTDKSRGPRGATAFVVDRDSPGVTIGKKEKKLGIRCSSTTEVHFQDVRIPKTNVLGKVGLGFRVAMDTLDKSRPGIGAQAVGIAQGAMEEALAFAKERVQFGQPITHFQAIQHMLADMGMNIEAARLLVYQAARLADRGEKSATVGKFAAMAKCFASDMAMKATVDAIQIAGGSGYMREYPLEKFMRDAKICQIYEGTNQIQRNVIAQAIIRESVSRQ